MGSVYLFFLILGGKVKQTRNHLFRGLHSCRKHAQSTEHILIINERAAEVLITPLELRARSIWSWSRLKTGSQELRRSWMSKICYIFGWKIIKNRQFGEISIFFVFSGRRLPRPRAAQWALRDATRRGWTWDTIKIMLFKNITFFCKFHFFDENNFWKTSKL